MPFSDIVSQYVLSLSQRSTNFSRLSAIRLGLLVFIKKPLIPYSIISSGPPNLGAKVGSPEAMASMTVSPKASNKAGCTNIPL